MKTFMVVTMSLLAVPKVFAAPACANQILQGLAASQKQSCQVEQVQMNSQGQTLAETGTAKLLCQSGELTVSFIASPYPYCGVSVISASSVY